MVLLKRRAITADMASRFSLYFGTSETFWMGLQDDYELEKAHLKVKDKLRHLIQPLQQ